MNGNPLYINLVATWAGILLGFVSGMLLGLFFHREKWLGGYASFRRRLYRLAHISFFGLALMNALFFFSMSGVAPTPGRLLLASWLFVAGAVTMPLCCLLTAHWPGLRHLFAVPVVSLLTAGTITLLQITGL